MYRFSSFLCLLIIPALAFAGGHISHRKPGATANTLSHIMIQGFRFSAAEKENPNLAMQCVIDMDDHGLSEVIESYLDEHLTEEQLTVSDNFHRTPLADKFYKYAVQKQMIKSGMKIFHPIKFSDSEKKKIMAFVNSDAGMALTRLATPSDPEFKAKVDPVMDALIAPCRTQPM